MSTLFKKVTASVAALSIVLSIVSPVVGVKAADDATSAANRLAALGVIVDNSKDPSKYNLGSNITRREMLKVMMNLSSVEVGETCEGKFADLPKSDWGCKYAEAALKAGFIAANPKFRPNDLVTEAEALKMIMQARGVAKTEGIADWAQAYADAAAKAGIVAAGTKVSATAAAKRSFTIVSADSAVTSTTGDAADNAGEDDLGDLFGDLFGDDNGTDMGTGSTTEETTSTGTTTTPTTKAGELEVSLNPESPTGNVAAGAARTAVLAFDVTAGKEDLTLKEATVKFVGTGDESVMDELSVYLGNTKVSKQTSKSFDDDNEAVLTFEKNFVVKAGETQKLVVTSKIGSGAANTNQTLKVALVELSSSAASLKGLPVTGSALTPVSVTNKAAVTATASKANETVTVGKSVKLAGFELEETSKKEDVVVKSVTFTVSGSIDAEDDLSDLVLYADGKEIASKLEVNGDDEIVADLEYTIAADDKVKFELKGTVTGSINKTIELVFDDADDIYVVGKSTGISLDITGVNGLDIAAAKTIEGSEINVSFDKSDIDEAKPNAEGVLVGTVKFTAANEYTIDELQVTVEASSGNVTSAVETLELDGSAYDSKGTGTGKVVYSFKDISLEAGKTVTLPLTLDVVDSTALNGTDLTFDVKVAQVTDEENDETYSSNVSDVLSTNSFNKKTVSVESATLTVTQTAVSAKDLVIGNGVEVVLYKGKVSVGDADNVLVNDITFKSNVLTGSYDLQDIVDSAKLNVGGKTYTADVETDGLEFTSIAHKFDAGVDNVEVTVTATLKDTEKVNNGDALKLTLVKADIDSEDADGENLLSANVVVNAVAGNTNVVNLNEQGTLTFQVVDSGDYKDEVKSVVLAGASSVALAEVKMEAKQEDVKVKELTLTISGDFSTTLKNVKLVNAATKATIVDGATVTYSAPNTKIVFKNDFVLADASNEVKALLVADVEKFTDKGGEVSAATGDMVVAYSLVEATGVASNNDITGGFLTANGSGETVTVVPALVTVSIVDELGTNDKDAIVRFAIDKGNNEFTDDSIYFKSLELETAVASGVTLRNDDDAAFVLTNSAAKVLTLSGTSVDNKIVNSDEFTLKVENDGDELRVIAKGIKYTIGAGSTQYTIVNDKVINLGEYAKD